MDVISHGLWGGIAFGRKSKKSFWLALFFGTFPDIFAFGVFFIASFLGLTTRPNFAHEPPDPTTIPSYVYQLYSISHSLIVFVAVFIFAWIIFRKPIWELGAWGLHILFDIPTHSYAFFPTPFIWPISEFRINGHSWGDPIIFFPNIIVLAVLYICWFIYRRRKT